jgi:hypothetical protein
MDQRDKTQGLQRTQPPPRPGGGADRVQEIQVFLRDLAHRSLPQRAPVAIEVSRRPLYRGNNIICAVEKNTPSRHQLGMAPAAQRDRHHPASDRLGKRIRAGIIAVAVRKNVGPTKDVRYSSGIQRRHMADVAKGDRAISTKSHRKSAEIHCFVPAIVDLEPLFQLMTTVVAMRRRRRRGGPATVGETASDRER